MASLVVDGVTFIMDTMNPKGDNGDAAASHPPASDVSHIIIEQLLRENAKLRERQKRSYLVEITGDGGSPVYSTGYLNHGRWRFAHGGLSTSPIYSTEYFNHGRWRFAHGGLLALAHGGLWDVDLETASYFDGSAESNVIPIREIGSIHAYVGGVLHATSDGATAMMADGDWDRDMAKEVIFQLGGNEPTASWLTVRINQWPESVGAVARGNMYPFITNVLPGMYPNASFSFVKIALFGSSVEKILKHDDIGQPSEEEKREEQEFMEFYTKILRCYREAGNSETGMPFDERVNAIYAASYMFESLEIAEEEIPALVDMQLAAGKLV